MSGSYLVGSNRWRLKSSRHDRSRSMKLTQYPLALTIAVCSFSAAQSANMGPTAHQPFQARHFDQAADTTTKMAVDVRPAAVQEVTEETRMKLRHEFGFSFLIYRDKIQAELGLSPEQKGALEKYLSATAPADMAFLQSNDAHQSEFEAFRSKALAELDSTLKETLTDAQRKRLSELVRQREGLFGGPSLWTGLQITDDEKSQFMAVIEPMHKKMDAVVAESQHGTNPADFQRQLLGLRVALERQLEAVLTDAQRHQWKEMLGKPIATDALFDLSSG